jgi:DHA1 family multidrug resistance protein-like MFS transporter
MDPMPLPAHSLSNRQRRRGVTALIVSNFLSWAGFFLLVPLIAVHYVEDLGWAAGLIGVMLAVRQFSQQGLAPIFGVVCDRTGPKPLICAGQLVRAVGFGSLAFVESTGGVLLAMILAGLGGAMFEAPKSSAMAALTSPEERQRRYALLGVTSGLGVTLGTQAGAVLIKQDFGTVALVAASVYVFLSAWIAIVLPRMHVSTGSLKAMEGLSRVWHDRPFVTLVGITIGYYFAANQFTLTFTLAAADVADSNSAVAWIYLVNTAISVGLGYFVPRWLERWLSPVDAVALGTIVIARPRNGRLQRQCAIDPALCRGLLAGRGGLAARTRDARRQPRRPRCPGHLLWDFPALARDRRCGRVPPWRFGVRLR